MIEDVNFKLLSLKHNNNKNYEGNISSNKRNLGIIKFSYRNKTYIHCPIKNVLADGTISFGVCERFKTLENSLRNRQRLCTHKFRYHYKSLVSSAVWCMMICSRDMMRCQQQQQLREEQQRHIEK
jgi:hypothetical protein